MLCGIYLNGHLIFWVMEDIVNVRPRIHVFVCVNNRCGIAGNIKPSCGPTITPEMVKEVKLWLRMRGLTSVVYCTLVKCLGFCSTDGGVMCVYPQGRFVKGLLTVEDIKKVIGEEMSRVGID